MSGYLALRLRFVSALALPCVCMVAIGGCSSPTQNAVKPDPRAKPAKYQLTAEEAADGWIQLFDGETLFGWTATSDANWAVADGEITVSSGTPGFLRSNSQFGDCELHIEFKSAPGTNSGVFLQTAETPHDITKDCYELNIADVGVSPFPTGSFVGRQVAAGDESEQKARDKDVWQTFHVSMQDGVFIVDLDGERVLEYTDPQPLRKGHLLLQLNSGEVAFRNIKLRPLGLKDTMTESTFDQAWTDAGKQSADFQFADGELHVSGGPGQLETRDAFADFVVQTEVMVNGDGLNSGIFFRNIPGEVLQGYESQIHNGFKNNDRGQPVDAGTGAIFRRQAARRVVADDRQWFTKTIICTGDHMAVWVNGYPVTDWTDERPDAENPREGRRLAAGTIALQAHDPTTDFLFRNFQVSELAARPE